MTRNIPYRGEVDHGVPHDVINPLDEGVYWKDADETEYEDEEKAIQPIPVRLVDRGAREIRGFSTRTYSLTVGVVQQIADRNLNRKSISIRSLGGEIVFVGNNPSVSTISGFPVVGTNTLTITSHESIWVISPDNAETLFVLEEYTDEVD